MSNPPLVITFLACIGSAFSASAGHCRINPNVGLPYVVAPLGRETRGCGQLNSEWIVAHSSRGTVHRVGSMPIWSFTADEIRWVQPR
jgi:hypothetical protein